MNFITFMSTYSTESKIIDHYKTIRYGSQITCNHCGSEKVYPTHQEKFYQCNSCNNTFSIFKGTIFEKSDTDLRKWFYAIHLFLNSKKGISGYQLMREINVTYKTAWRMLKQIRLAMGNKETSEMFQTIIEIDETYVGGKPRHSNDKDDKPDNKRGRGTKKTPIVGLKERSTKKIHAEVMLPDKDNKKLSGKQILSIIDRICMTESTIITDEFGGYKSLKKRNYTHLIIDHQKAYVNGHIYTNGIESFWALLKRGIYGIYHHVSVKYLQSYIDEFVFRSNNKDINMFDLVLKQSVLK